MRLYTKAAVLAALLGSVTDVARSRRAAAAALAFEGEEISKASAIELLPRHDFDQLDPEHDAYIDALDWWAEDEVLLNLHLGGSYVDWYRAMRRVLA
jgi:hypothetical protein